MIEALLQKAEAIERKQHKEAEKLKEGNLRVGSCGAILPNGDVIGNCHRLVMLRLLGIEEDVGLVSELCMKGGIISEDEILRLLRLVHPDVRSDEDTPVKFTLPSGRDITGRPDGVLYTDDKPDLVIEMKGVFSANAAVSVIYKDMPKAIEHVIQCALYMKGLDAPGLINYWSSAYYMPHYSQAKKYGIKGSIRPFRKQFPIKVDNNGKLAYCGDAGWTATPVTTHGITDFYSLIDDMVAKKDLYRKPKNILPNGEKASYSACQYCEMKDTCSRTDNYDEFISEAKEIFNET